MPADLPVVFFDCDSVYDYILVEEVTKKNMYTTKNEALFTEGLYQHSIQNEITVVAIQLPY